VSTLFSIIYNFLLLTTTQHFSFTLSYSLGAIASNDDIAKNDSKPFTDLLSLTFPTPTNQNQRLLPWYSWLPLPQRSLSLWHLS